jgi:hypothetical protein
MTQSEKTKMIRYANLVEKKTKTMDEMEETMDLMRWTHDNGISYSVIPEKILDEIISSNA